MLKLNKTVDIDIRRFFLWWGRELAFLVPEKVSHFVSDKSGITIIKALDNSYEISLLNDEQLCVIAELESSEKGKAEFKKLQEKDVRIRNADFIIRLSSTYAIKKEIYLPEAAADKLYQVVLFELDKYTPFSTDQVYFSVKQIDKEASGLIKIALILTPKDEMDLIYNELKSWGVTPKLADFDGEPNSFNYTEPSYNLLRDILRTKGVQPQYALPWVLTGIATILLMAVLALPVYLEGQQVDSLKAQLKPLTKDTLWVESQQSEIDSIYDKTVSLINKKKQTASVVELINTLSELINDDTWLTHLQLKKGKLQIQGQSPSASSLIGVLEASPSLSNARFVSPLTQDKKTGLERFQISVEITKQKVTGDE
jgi:general secretion pathway protein L